MSDRLVLALDGSTKVSSSALLSRRADETGDGWDIVASREELDAHTQAKVLLSSVDDMLRGLGAGPKDLGGIVVGIGPGTFTGVRIAVATARGLALALGIPVFGVSTLASLAAAAAAAEGIMTDDVRRLVPVVDARRKQVFHTTFERRVVGRGGDLLEWVREGEIEVTDREEVGRRIETACEGKTVLVGEDRDLVGELPADVVFEKRLALAQYLVAGQQRLVEPRVDGGGMDAREWLAQVGRSEKQREGREWWVPAAEGPGSPEWVKPVYVRAPDADMHITKMKDPWGDDR